MSGLHYTAAGGHNRSSLTTGKVKKWTENDVISTLTRLRKNIRKLLTSDNENGRENRTTRRTNTRTIAGSDKTKLNNTSYRTITHS